MFGGNVNMTKHEIGSRCSVGSFWSGTALSIYRGAIVMVPRSRSASSFPSPESRTCRQISKAFHDCHFPFPLGPAADLQVSCHVFDRPEQFEADPFSPFQEVPPLGVAEYHSGDAFLYHAGPAAIFNLVYGRITLAFPPQKCSQYGRPTQDAGIRQVKNVVESITVIVVPVVPQVITDLLAVDEHFDDLGPSLVDRHAHLSRQAFLRQDTPRQTACEAWL